MSSLIQINNISKSYWRDSLEIPVLNNITVDVPEGEFLALMGPSGSGKTTLLNLIGGIDKPSKGSVVIDGEEISSYSESKLAKWRSDNVGFIFQFYNLIPVLTAFENVELPLLLTNLNKAERKKKVEFALGIVGLGDRIQLEKEVEKLRKKHKVENPIYFMPIIESALGVIKAYEIASASKNNCALAIGLEDYTADIGTQRTNEGRESIFARQMLVNAARAAGIQPIDTVFSDVTDMEALRQSVIEAKSLGFEGKGCIHPRQIKVVHEAFAPTAEEIEKAKKIILAFEEAEKKGFGVVALGSKMIDPPVVKRALRTIDLAVMNNLLDKNWKKH